METVVRLPSSCFQQKQTRKVIEKPQKINRFVFCHLKITFEILSKTFQPGMIAAAIVLSNKIGGGNFKYRDYFESLGLYLDRDLIRHRIRNLTLLNNLTYLDQLLDLTPQPKFPISVDSIIQTYPFPIRNNHIKV